MSVTKGFLIVIDLCALVGLFFVYLAFTTSGMVSLGWSMFAVIAFFCAFVVGIIYSLWFLIFENKKKKDTRRKTPPPSRFMFTKDGEIIEVVEDEKRKRGAASMKDS